MKFDTVPSGLAHQRRARGWSASVLTSVLVAAVVACGGSGTSNPFDLPVPDTTTLAGTWKGSMNGTFGYSVTTLFPKGDSTMTWESENVLYCKVTGTWTVSGGQFTSTGRDCTGTIITSSAPIDKLRLTGTWSASSGRSGTFTVAKQ